MIEWFLGLKKTPLIQPHFIVVPVPSQESVRSCICVLGVSFPSLYQARKVCGHVFVCYDYVVKNYIYSNGDLDL